MKSFIFIISFFSQLIYAEKNFFGETIREELSIMDKLNGKVLPPCPKAEEVKPPPPSPICSLGNLNKPDPTIPQVCLNEPGGKESKTVHLGKSFEEYNFDISVRNFLNTRKIKNKCVPSEEIPKYPPRVAKQIDRKCLDASIKRDIAGDGYQCTAKGKIKFKNSPNSPCYTPHVADFVQFTLNEGIECLSQGREPIDARIILKKLNLETGFNFYMANDGGKGIGQLTDPPIKDLSGWTENGKFRKGDAQHILKGIAESKSPYCKSFKSMAEEDLKSPAPLPGNPANYCHWVNPGNGVARNIMYALGYFIHLRDDLIGPHLKAKGPQFAKDPDVLNYFTMIGYGPKGQRYAKALMDTFRLKSVKQSSDEVKKKILAHSAYVSSAEKKMSELLDKLNIKSPTKDDKKGDLCVF